MRLGFTYSHKRAQHLQLDIQYGLQRLLQLNPHIIRLCIYWSDVEKEKGKYDFSSLIPLLEVCEKVNQKVVITVGMKAPHWPEYYFPTWLGKKEPDYAAQYVLPFIRACVTTLRHYKIISYWQVENEPLDPSGPQNITISKELLEKEITSIKQLDPSRDTIVTVWGNDLIQRNCYNDAANISDILGIDLYYKQFITRKLSISLYMGPKDSTKKIQQCMKEIKKKFWITELQAEPWEADEYAYKSDTPKSMNPKQLKNNIEKAINLHPEYILLWGSEYWLWREKHGDSRMIQAVEKIFASYL